MHHPLRIVLLVAAFACVFARGASAQWDSQDPAAGGDSLQILDRSLMPAYVVDLTIISESKLEEFGDTTTVEFGGEWQVAYFQDVLQSDVDLNLGAEITLLTDSAGVELPDQLGRIYFDSGATWHYVNETALEARFKPTVNTDFEEIDGDSIFLPVSVAVRKAFDPRFSGVVGLELRPDYELLVMPIVALGWIPHERVHVKAGLPESRLTYYATPKLTPYLGLDWASTTYTLHDEEGLDRGELTLEDFRMYAGLRYRITEEMQFVTDVGEVFGRDFEFGREIDSLPREISAESSMFIRFALLGPF